MPDTALLLQTVALLGSGLAAARLVQNGLWRKYPALTLYLAFHTLEAAIPLFLNSKDPFYIKVYVCSQPIIWTFYILMVREIYGLALASHRGLQTLGKWAMYIATGISVTLSLLSILKKITPKVPELSDRKSV